MGIAILNELQNRLYTLAIAGTNLLAEDFRLKKTAEQFHAVAASSPVLSKIDKLVQQLLEEDNKEKEISVTDWEGVEEEEKEEETKSTFKVKRISLASSTCQLSNKTQVKS